MTQKITTLLASFAAVVFISATVATVIGSPAIGGCSGPACVTDGVNAVGETGGGADLPTVLKTIVGVLLFAVGAVAVIMIVIAGIKYVTANGDTSALSNAKNTILYSVIGLIVALMAYAVVNFIITQFVK